METKEKNTASKTSSVAGRAKRKAEGTVGTTAKETTEAMAEGTAGATVEEIAQGTTYASAAAEIDAILENLQSGECSVDELVAQVRRATRLLAFCQDRLTRTDEELKKLFEE